MFPEPLYHTWVNLCFDFECLGGMALTLVPLVHPGHVQLHQRRPGETFVRRLATPTKSCRLADCVPDEATDHQGNCGIDAFARSLLAQMKDGRVGAGQRVPSTVEI